MNIVSGSGRNRSVFTFPCAEIVNRSPKGEQKMAKSLLCRMLSVPNEGAVAV